MNKIVFCITLWLLSPQIIAMENNNNTFIQIFMRTFFPCFYTKISTFPEKYSFEKSLSNESLSDEILNKSENDFLNMEDTFNSIDQKEIKTNIQSRNDSLLDKKYTDLLNQSDDDFLNMKDTFDSIDPEEIKTKINNKKKINTSSFPKNWEPIEEISSEFSSESEEEIKEKEIRKVEENEKERKIRLQKISFRLEKAYKENKTFTEVLNED
ncbi:hypothetical protein KAH94_00425 [bacterium]|nr:hypothetical protein [bacterium]